MIQIIKFLTESIFLSFFLLSAMFTWTNILVTQMFRKSWFYFLSLKRLFNIDENIVMDLKFFGPKPLFIIDIPWLYRKYCYQIKPREY